MTSNEDFHSRLDQWSQADLIDLLHQVYMTGDKTVSELIEFNMLKNDPKELAKFFRTKINGWIRRTRFISYRESFELARKMEKIREGIERLLLPRDPKSAWKIIDRVVRNDGKIYRALDDSGGAVGEVLNNFSLMWLDAAAAMNQSQAHWIDLVIEINDGDEYGCRNEFLKSSNRLLNRESLIKIYEHYHLTSNLDACQTALALEDPDLYEKTLREKCDPLNDQLLLDASEVHLKYHSPARAKELLDAIVSDPYLESRKNRLVERYYELTENEEERKEFRHNRWTNDPSVTNLEACLEFASPEEQLNYCDLAHDAAFSDDELYRALTVFVYLDKMDDMQQMALERQNEFGHWGYTTLLNLLELIGSDRTLAVQTLLYRALLTDILDRAFSKGYNHAARYYKKLGELDHRMNEYPALLTTHSDFLEMIKAKHFRKYGFWNRVDA